MIREERIVYLVLRADGEVSHQSASPNGFDSLGHDEVMLRIIGRRISSGGPFKPVSVEIVTP